MKSKINRKKNIKVNKKGNIKVNKLKTQKKRNINHKGGCDLPAFPDGDDVWERRNGIRSGNFFSILQFYKFIDWSTCNKMYKFGEKMEKKESSFNVMKNVIEGEINKALQNFVIYDTSGQIETTQEIPSPSFVFGNAIINMDEKTVIFYQSQKDQYDDTKLSFKFLYNTYIHVIINKKNEKDKKNQISKNEVFFFPKEDSKFKLGLKNYKMPSTNIQDILKAMREGRKAMLNTQQSLSRSQEKEQRIQSGNQGNQKLVQ